MTLPVREQGWFSIVVLGRTTEMNKSVLQTAEKNFLELYPGGFENAELVTFAKKFKMDQHQAFARDNFSKAQFEYPTEITANIAKLVSRSAVVSLFEKPKFKSAMVGLRGAQAEAWSSALYEQLHGKQKAGFESLVELLAQQRLAKWTLASLLPSYYRPQKEVFVKPSTAKLIISELELPLEYQARPTWSFYRDFRRHIKTMREITDSCLAPSNVAYCGFLMMALPSKS